MLHSILSFFGTYFQYRTQKISLQCYCKLARTIEYISQIFNIICEKYYQDFLLQQGRNQILKSTIKGIEEATSYIFINFWARIYSKNTFAQSWLFWRIFLVFFTLKKNSFLQKSISTDKFESNLFCLTNSRVTKFLQ